MRDWWYRLNDGSIVPWDDGDDLPANVDFLYYKFLNQFVDRINLRLACVNMVDGGITGFMSRVSAGAQAMKTSFITGYADKFRLMDNYYYVGNADPTAEAFSDASVAVADDVANLGTILGILDSIDVGETTYSYYLKKMREALKYATDFVRPPSWDSRVAPNNTKKYGLAGSLINGSISYRKYRWNKDDSRYETLISGAIDMPYDDSTGPWAAENMGNYDFIYTLPCGRWADILGGYLCFDWSMQFRSFYHGLTGRTVATESKIYTIGAQPVGESYVYDSVWAGHSTIHVPVLRATGELTLVGASNQLTISLPDLGSLDYILPDEESIANSYALIFMYPDEANTPDIDETV